MAASYLIISSANAQKAARVVCAVMAKVRGVPWPMPGTRITGGLHGPGGFTAYLDRVLLSADGTQAAVPMPAALAAAISGKTVTLNGMTVTFPVAVADLPVGFDASPPELAVADPSIP